MVESLHQLINSKRFSEVEAAIAAGAELNELNSFGATPLHRSIAVKCREVALALIRAGADVTRLNEDGKTALHGALEYSLYEVAAEIVRQNPGAVRIVDSRGNEPLWTATFYAREDLSVVRLLLEHGADPMHKNENGLSPLDIPKRKNRKDLLELFRECEDRGR